MSLTHNTLAQDAQPPATADATAQAPADAAAAPAHRPGGEANLKLPDLAQVSFRGIDGRTLLYGFDYMRVGLVFGMVIYSELKNMPVHKSMLTYPT